MNLAPIAIAVAALFALSSKKKTAQVSKEPKIEKFGRVERLLNAAAIAASSVSQDTMPPTLIYAYIKKDAALERATAVMKAQADMFPNVDFYQIPIDAIRQSIGVKGGGPPKGAAGVLVGVHPSGALAPLAYIYPNDEIKDIAVKVAHHVLFALTGKFPDIKGS